MTDQAPEATTSKPQSERTKALNSAYAKATKQLRDENLDRFRELYVIAAKELGYDYTPKPTAEEKAEAELAALLAANPNLKSRLVDEIKATESQPEG